MGDMDNKSVFSVVIQVSSLNKTERYNITNGVNCVLFMYACTCITLFTLHTFNYKIIILLLSAILMY